MTGGAASDAAHFMEDHAYELIIAGWEIFQLRGKVPLIAKKDGGNGHLDATSDPAVIEKVWTKNPNANIGARPAPWMIVIDLDPRHGGTFELLVETAGPIPPTLHSFSGRGDGGMHLFYDRDGLGEITRDRLPVGIDVKDRDGYIVLPPSVHPETGQRYRWGNRREIAPLPEGLRRLLTPASRPVRHSAGFEIRGLGLDEFAQRRLRRMLETIETAPEGSRNDILNDLAYKAVTELGVGTNFGIRDLFAEAAQQCGLGDSEIKGTLRSAGFRS